MKSERGDGGSLTNVIGGPDDWDGVKDTQYLWLG